MNLRLESCYNFSAKQTFYCIIQTVDWLFLLLFSETLCHILSLESAEKRKS